MATGKPYSSTKASTLGVRDGVRVPGASGAPTFSATWRAETLSPRASMAPALGPIQVSPAALTARAKSAFSARKP